MSHTTLLQKIALSLGCLLVIFGATEASAATLSVTPDTGVYTAGGTFSARVIINTEGAPVNAAEGRLSFDASTLSVVNISRANSIFNLWTQDPSFSNTAGTIDFGGGATPPGYTGRTGTIMTITFRAKTAGTAKVSFTNGSVLAADGRGTNVLRSMNSGAYTVGALDVSPEPEQIIEYITPPNTPAAPSVQASNHPDTELWYTATNTTMSWVLPSGVTAVRTLLDASPGTVPTIVYDPPISERVINDLEQGVSYFHVQFKNENGWGKVRHYRLAVDSKAPTSFTISRDESVDPSAPLQMLQFDVADDTSLVKKFLIQIDGGEAFAWLDDTASGTYALPELEPGRHTVIVEAFDQANNSLIATYSLQIESFDPPRFTDYPEEISRDIIPVIKGETRANAKVFISLRPLGLIPTADAQARSHEVTADDNGVFVFIPNSRLDLGVYEITAVAVDQSGAQSEPSSPIRIAVQEPGYLQIGNLLVSILSVLISVVVLCFGLLFITVWFWKKLRSMRTRVHKEADEAYDVFMREHAALSKTLESEATKVAATRKGKKLTKAEAQLVTQVQTQLKKMHTRVQKELADVDEVIE